jgi:hypothetical protein
VVECSPIGFVLLWGLQFHSALLGAFSLRAHLPHPHACRSVRSIAAPPHRAFQSMSTLQALFTVDQRGEAPLSWSTLSVQSVDSCSPVWNAHAAYRQSFASILPLGGYPTAVYLLSDTLLQQESTASVQLSWIASQSSVSLELELDSPNTWQFTSQNNALHFTALLASSDPPKTQGQRFSALKTTTTTSLQPTQHPASTTAPVNAQRTEDSCVAGFYGERCDQVCPRGSYCPEGDTNEHLCRNAPADAHYTDTMVGTENCPFVCTTSGTYRLQNDCAPIPIGR